MRIIFFAPYNISEINEVPLDRAPSIRCAMIYKYLKLNNEVVLIGGNSEERNKKYKYIYKNNIIKDVDALYMESVNANLKNKDLKFIEFVSNNNVPMSMFYRDIYWKFPVYFNSFFQKLKYKRKYNKYQKQLNLFKTYFNIIYSPTEEFAKYATLDETKFLPPAGEIIKLNKTDDVNILFSGAKKDGFNDLILANNILVNKGYKYKLYLISKNIENKIADNIIINNEITEEIINDVHIGIIPMAKTEYHLLSFPFKYMQYLSYGLPVISTDIPSFIKYNNIYNNTLFYNGNAVDLADKIEVLLNNNVLRNDMSFNSLNAVKNNENWSNRVNMILEDLKNIKNNVFI